MRALRRWVLWCLAVASSAWGCHHSAQLHSKDSQEPASTVTPAEVGEAAAPAAKDEAKEPAAEGAKAEEAKEPAAEGAKAEEAKIMADKDESNNFIFVASSNWHPGIVGIIASKLVEAFELIRPEKGHQLNIRKHGLLQRINIKKKQKWKSSNTYHV